MRKKTLRFGKGFKVITGNRRVLKRHSLLLIEHGEQHQIRNTGREYLKTLNHNGNRGSRVDAGHRT
jgi:mannose-6-phosphate isomerase-like protein (cupin superfamily)